MKSFLKLLIAVLAIFSGTFGCIQAASDYGAQFPENYDKNKIVEDENETYDQDSESPDDDFCSPGNGGVGNFTTVIYTDDKCAYPGERNFRMLHIVYPADHPFENATNPEKSCTMTIESIEGGEFETYQSASMIEESDYNVFVKNQKYTDISGSAKGYKCWDSDNYTIRFSGYNKILFNESLIGKDVTFHTAWSYRGGAKVVAVAHEDGTWIVLNNVPADSLGLKPTTTIFRSGMLSCTTLCVLGMGYNGNDIRNYTVQPPVEFRIDGVEDYVLTRNGESLVSGDYEYYSDFSVDIADEDPDGKFTVEADYDPLPSSSGQFYFSILNIGALK